VHVAGIAAIEPLAQESELGKRSRWRDTAEIESESGGLALDVRRSRQCLYSLASWLCQL
jgi:hypothetical protein